MTDETFCLREGLNKVKRWGKDGGEDGKWLQAVDLRPGVGGRGGDVAATEWDLPPESGSGLVRACKGACGRICAVMV